MLLPSTDQSVTWVYTNDLDTTSAFYGEKLGLKKAYDQGRCRLFRWSQTSFIGICQVRPGRHVEPRGVVLTFVTPDVDAWHHHIIARGVTPEAPPECREQFNVYGFFVKDPNGYLLEFQTFLDPRWKQATV
jgi:catechol 2,3-dioxygenase-like lactoylglutathione lyase family enzyme